MIRDITHMRSRGGINILLLPFILVLLFLIGAGAFGLWAFSSREDYRVNTEQKISQAVQVAKQEEGIVKDKEHAEADKSPLKTYVGPEQFGSIHISYPKTWSGYIDVSTDGSQPVDGYFQPGVVPGISDIGSAFALRIQVLDQAYAEVISQMGAGVETKEVTAVPFAFAKVPSVVGTRFDGTIDPSKKLTGNMVVVPIRDKTIKIWTESANYTSDFNTFILPNLSFSP